MTKHYNPSIVERLNRIFRPKAGDQFSDEIQGPVAVIPVEPVARIVRSTSSAATGPTTVYTTPSDKDFYLTGFTFQAFCDAVADSSGYNMELVIDGATRNIAQVRKPSLTAGSFTQTHDFSKPLKIDRGTTIIIRQTFSVGASTQAGIIYGYTEEVIST